MASCTTQATKHASFEVVCGTCFGESGAVLLVMSSAQDLDQSQIQKLNSKLRELIAAERFEGGPWRPARRWATKRGASLKVTCKRRIGELGALLGA